MSKSENVKENKHLKNNDSEKESKSSIKIKLKIFLYCLRTTLISRIFGLSYPISLYFLYNENKLFTFFITLGIILLSIIYFIFYYNVYSKSYENKRPSKISFYGKQIIYCILGYLVQFNLMFFDISPKENNLKINYILCALKIAMIIEMLKRVYFYVVGSFILLEMEIRQRGDRCMYVMTFEIVYDYLWDNYFNNSHSGGFHLSLCFHLLGLFFSLLNGIFAFGSNFMIFKIFIFIMNLGFLFAQKYSIYWRKRECY